MASSKPSWKCRKAMLPFSIFRLLGQMACAPKYVVRLPFRNAPKQKGMYVLFILVFDVLAFLLQYAKLGLTIVNKQQLPMEFAVIVIFSFLHPYSLYLSPISSINPALGRTIQRLYTNTSTALLRNRSPSLARVFLFPPNLGQADPLSWILCDSCKASKYCWDLFTQWN